MPSGSEFKRIIRDRMRVTDVRYAVALAAVVEAARAAVPRRREDPLAELPELGGSALAELILDILPDLAERRRGPSHRRAERPVPVPVRIAPGAR
jgi:hypothetical protein